MCLSQHLLCCVICLEKPPHCEEDKRSLIVQGHPEEVYACEFLDQSKLLTASADRLFLWDMEIGACIQEASCTPGPLHQGTLSCALAPDMSPS